MCHLIILSSADLPSPLGRLDYASLPQQTLMELLVGRIFQRERIPSSIEPKDIAEWEGVKLDENGNVIEIDWSRRSLEGTPSLEWIPSNVEKFDISLNKNLSGTVDFAKLTPSLVLFDVTSNKLTGKLDIGLLPEHLKNLSIGRNQFTGTLELEKLPNSMIEFGVYTNHFTGTLDLTKLPSELETLIVSDNKLYGSVDLTHLPGSLLELHLDCNTFSGTINLQSLPDELQELMLNNNNFEGETDFNGLPHLQQFGINNNVNLSGVIECDLESDFPYIDELDVTKTNIKGIVMVNGGYHKIRW